jgi:uncharacterized protein
LTQSGLSDVRVVLDTNIVISALLWNGPESHLLAAARSHAIQLRTSTALIEELLDVLPRTKFQRKLQAAGLTATQLVYRYALLAPLVLPVDVAAHIHDDADDDAVLACAIATIANLIVSGDRHLLQLKHYHRIQIVTAAEALKTIAGQHLM